MRRTRKMRRTREMRTREMRRTREMCNGELIASTSEMRKSVRFRTSYAA